MLLIVYTQYCMTELSATAVNWLLRLHLPENKDYAADATLQL